MFARANMNSTCSYALIDHDIYICILGQLITRREILALSSKEDCRWGNLVFTVTGETIEQQQKNRKILGFLM